MAGEGSRFLEAASAVGRKACPEVSKIDPADPPLTTSQPISRRARLACTRPSSLKRPIALKSKAVLGRASHRISPSPPLRASGRGRDRGTIPETYRHFSGPAPSQRRGDSCFIPETYRHFSRSETYRQFESSQRRTDILEPWFLTPGHPRHVPTFCKPPVEIPETFQHFTSHPRHVPTFLAASRGIPETSQHFHAALSHLRHVPTFLHKGGTAWP